MERVKETARSTWNRFFGPREGQTEVPKSADNEYRLLKLFLVGGNLKAKYWREDKKQQFDAQICDSHEGDKAYAVITVPGTFDRKVWTPFKWSDYLKEEEKERYFVVKKTADLKTLEAAAAKAKEGQPVTTQGLASEDPKSAEAAGSGAGETAELLVDDSPVFVQSNSRGDSKWFAIRRTADNVFYVDRKEVEKEEEKQKETKSVLPASPASSSAFEDDYDFNNDRLNVILEHSQPWTTLETAWMRTKVVSAGITTAAVFVIGFPYIVSSIGFGAIGIGSKSFAATMMAKGFMGVPLFQSIGAAGMGLASKLVVAVSGGAVGGLVASAAAWSTGRRNVHRLPDGQEMRVIPLWPKESRSKL